MAWERVDLWKASQPSGVQFPVSCHLSRVVADVLCSGP